MLRTIIALVAVCLSATSTAWAEEGQLLYPRDALEQGVGGTATLACTIREDGALTCEVAQESPQGMGFGEAALVLSRDWRVPAEMPDGMSTAGGALVRTVEFEPGPPPAISQRSRRVTNPQWEVNPTAADYARHYPPEALRRRVSGAVVLDCAVNLDHTLTCEVTSENPQGQGFGEAALGIAQVFRVTPTMWDDVPVEGGRVRVPIRFGWR